MTITRVGTNQQYGEGWDKAFSGKKGASSAKKPADKPSPKKAAGKKAPPKKAGKKSK